MVDIPTILGEGASVTFIKRFSQNKVYPLHLYRSTRRIFVLVDEEGSRVLATNGVQKGARS